MGMCRGLMRIWPSKVRSPEGDLRRRLSCKLFARGRDTTVPTQRASSEAERLKGLVKRPVDRPLVESKERGPGSGSSTASTTGRFTIASSILREGGQPFTGRGSWTSSCAALGCLGGETDPSPPFPARVRSLTVKEC